MPEYEIQQYELHVMTHRVTAKSLTEALEKLSDGDTDTGEFEYIEVPEERGALGIREITKPDGTVINGQDPKGKAKIIQAMQRAAAQQKRGIGNA